jgi:hypothetical protein
MKLIRPAQALAQQGLEQGQLAKMPDGTVNMLPNITQTELLRVQPPLLRQHLRQLIPELAHLDLKPLKPSK